MATQTPVAPPPAARVTFDQALNVVEQLSPDEREDLIEVIRRRLAAERRQRLVEDARLVEEEFEQGLATPTTAKELMREIMG